MEKIEAFIQPFKLEEVKDVVAAAPSKAAPNLGPRLASPEAGVSNDVREFNHLCNL